MSISNKMVVGLVAAAVSLASAGAFAQGYDDRRYDPRYDPRYEDRYDDRQDGAYDYAKVVDVQPLMRRIRVTTPQRECWDETRYDDRGLRAGTRGTAGGTLLGAVIGAAIGNQVGSGDGRRAATAAGAIIGAGIGRNQAERRQGQAGAYPPPRAYTVERCEVRYNEQWEERIDGYRVTYVYNGRRQVTELPYNPGDRIRVRVDVSPAE